MAKKTSLNNVVATSSFKVVRNVTLRSKEERKYQSKNEATGKVSEYYRDIVVLEDKGSKNIFGKQLVFCLNPEEDTAVPALKKAPVGTEGIAVFEIRYFVKNEMKTERNGEESIIPFTHETEVNLIDFLFAEDDDEDDDEEDEDPITGWHFPYDE